MMASTMCDLATCFLKHSADRIATAEPRFLCGRQGLSRPPYVTSSTVCRAWLRLAPYTLATALTALSRCLLSTVPCSLGIVCVLAVVDASQTCFLVTYQEHHIFRPPAAACSSFHNCGDGENQCMPPIVFPDPRYTPPVHDRAEFCVGVLDATVRSSQEGIISHVIVLEDEGSKSV